MQQLILQDRHVAYRVVETILSISGTSIHLILHEHLSVKKIYSHWTTHNLSFAQKKARIDWSKEMLQKYDCYDIVTGDESWIYAYEPESKQQFITCHDVIAIIFLEHFFRPIDTSLFLSE